MVTIKINLTNLKAFIAVKNSNVNIYVKFYETRIF